MGPALYPTFSLDDLQQPRFATGEKVQPTAGAHARAPEHACVWSSQPRPGRRAPTDQGLADDELASTDNQTVVHSAGRAALTGQRNSFHIFACILLVPF